LLDLALLAGDEMSLFLSADLDDLSLLFLVDLLFSEPLSFDLDFSDLSLLLDDFDLLTLELIYIQIVFLYLFQKI